MNTAKQVSADSATKTAVLYRRVMPDHVCPYGIKSKALLKRNGYDVEDKHLQTKEATNAFRAEHGVETTPQTFINGQRIGGYDDLRKYFGEKVRGPDETTYRPVFVIFAVAALMALALHWFAFQTLIGIRLIEWFVAISMCFLAVQKLRDVENFSTMFLNYDLLAKRWVRYSYLYPYGEALDGEALAGILMISGSLICLSSPIALFIGGVGAASIVKAVYIDKRELKCACVGGASNVPLGFVSLTENIMMIAMGIWMAVKTTF